MVHHLDTQRRDGRGSGAAAIPVTIDGGAKNYRKWASALTVVVLIAFLVSVPSIASSSVQVVRGGAVIAWTVFAWAFGLFPEPLVTLILFFLVVVFDIVAPNAIFSGFHSPAWWLVFAGSIIEIAVQTTGLGARVAGSIFGRVHGSYLGYVSAVAVSAVALAFVLPATTARILILMPVVLVLADRLGLGANSNGRAGLVMTVAAASYMPPATILPANVPNGVLFGAAHELYNIDITYGSYFLLHFPILGALKTIAIIWFVCRLYPERKPLPKLLSTATENVSSSERALSVILAISLLFFATDSFHKISPAWISLAVAILCLLPAMGIVSVKTFAERVRITPLIYIAGFLGLGAVIDKTGFGTVISHELLRVADLTPGDSTKNAALLALIGAGIGLFTPLPGLPAVLTPLANDFSALSGLPLYTVLMLQVPVFSTVFFPYQSPPMMIAMHLGGVDLRSATKLCLMLAGFTVIVLLPMDYMWGSILGYFP